MHKPWIYLALFWYFVQLFDLFWHFPLFFFFEMVGILVMDMSKNTEILNFRMHLGLREASRWKLWQHKLSGADEKGSSKYQTHWNTEDDSIYTCKKIVFFKKPTFSLVLCVEASLLRNIRIAFISNGHKLCANRKTYPIVRHGKTLEKLMLSVKTCALSVHSSVLELISILSTHSCHPAFSHIRFVWLCIDGGGGGGCSKENVENTH